MIGMQLVSATLVETPKQVNTTSADAINSFTMHNQGDASTSFRSYDNTIRSLTEADNEGKHRQGVPRWG